MSVAVNTYCSIPCPFFYPTAPPKVLGELQSPKRPGLMGRASLYDYEDFDNLPEYPPLRYRPYFRRAEEKPEVKPQPKPDPPPAKKPKPPVEESAPSESASHESAAKKKEPCPPPPKKFFASLCSIPGAVVDTMLSGEIVV
uniref:Uncharacterized protein n=1 Tax=Heliothis virescens TaxID=7102 RepID=A0A2A4JCQ7_HELVI